MRHSARFQLQFHAETSQRNIGNAGGWGPTEKRSNYIKTGGIGKYGGVARQAAGQTVY